MPRLSPRGTPTVALIAVADRFLPRVPDSFPYNWGEGVQQIGLMSTPAHRDGRYLTDAAGCRRERKTMELLNISIRSRRRASGSAVVLDRPGYPAVASGVPHANYRKVVAATAEYPHAPNGARRLGHWQAVTSFGWTRCTWLPAARSLGPRNRAQT